MARPFDRSRPGVWLSAVAHGALLSAGLLAFAVDKLPDSEEGIPVEMITDNQVSEITRGQTNAAAVQPSPKPRVDRLAETRVDRDPGEAKQDAPAPATRPADVKAADEDVEPAPVPPKRPEIAKVEPPPPPPARPDTSKADAAKAEAARAEAAAAKAEKAEAVKLALREEAEEKAAAEQARLDAKARSEAKSKAEADAKAAARAKAEADAKADLDRKIKEAEVREKAEADAKTKAEQRKKLADAKAKAEAKKAEADAKARRQAEVADKFSPGDISKLLNSKAPSQSTGATGSEVQRTASLGTATGNAARLNPSQRDQIAGVIREQLIRCWQPPVAVQGVAKPPTATVRLGLRQDGSLAVEPAVVNSSNDPLFGPVRDSALRATRRCAPLRIPTQFVPFYQDWKDLVVDFDPREIS